MPTPSTPILLAAGLLLGLAGLLWRGRARRRGRAFVEVAPCWRAFLRRQGFTEPRHFLDLSAAVVSGHPGRSVARAMLTDGDSTINVFVKREYRVSWAVRFSDWAAGFGFVSRSLREARTLEALGREGVGRPEWLAAGEDGCGRAFLLVRETPGTTDLRAWLGRETDPEARRRLARSLGAALARMHAAGFTHPDLYSKHVLVGADGESVQFLDWQRSRRRLVVDARRRARDLAALHATLADELARPRERLACLRAYAAGLGPRRGFLRMILQNARRLLDRRHIREKRQPPLACGIQEWMTLEGGALCVTPALAAAWPGRPPEWLALDRQPPGSGKELMRRWLTTAVGAPALMVRRRRRLSAADLWRWLRGRPPAEPEQRQAELLLRLQRHAVEAPRVLAMGRRVALGCVESFVLTQPAEGVVGLTAWLARRPASASRRRVLAETGAVLRRLHDAACFLDGRDPAAALAVQSTPDGRPVVLLAEAEHVRALRRPHPVRARRGVTAVERALADAGCGPADRRRFLAGYRRPAPGDATAASPPPRWPGYRTADALPPHGDSAMSASPLAAADAPADAAHPPAGSFWSRLWRGARRLRQQPDWPRFAGPDWPDRVMDVAVTDRFHAKQGRSTGRWILHADGPEPRRLAVYLKRHSSAPWWDRLRATLWPGGGWSPAFKEWDHLEWARSVGVPVPRAVAAAEYVGPAGRLRSFLAVEELHDMLPLNEAVPLAAARLAPADFRRWKRGLIAEVARLTRLLHDRRRFHKDLYLCHFFIRRTDAADPDPAWRGRVFLIDLHRLGRHAWTWLWWRMKDLAQLLYSTDVPGIGARDRLSYWRAYRGPGPRRLADRWLVRLVLFKWGRYRRHNARRKAREALRNGDRNQGNAPAGGGESS